MASLALDFLIIGAEKSATTFVQACLREHPSICMPPGETPFFEDPEFAKTSLSALADLAALAEPGQLFGIKRPNYLALPEVAPRIRTAAPNARLIVLLRHPIDRAVSAYFHNVKYGFLPCVPIERGLAELLRKRLDHRHKGRPAEVLEFGFYGRHLRAYLNHFPPEQMLVLRHEDLSASPCETIQKIYRFLGVEAEHVPASVTRRVNVGIYSLPLLRAFLVGNRFRYTYNETRSRLYARERGNGVRIAGAMIAGLHKLRLLGHGRSGVRLSEDLVHALGALYRDDLRELSELGVISGELWSDLAAVGDESRRRALPLRVEAAVNRSV